MSFVSHYQPGHLLPVMNTHSFAYSISTCIFFPMLSFHALKELTVKRHKINILTCIKYLHYHNSYYLILCPFVTSFMANLCINTCLKSSSHLLLSSLPTYPMIIHLYFVYNLNWEFSGADFITTVFGRSCSSRDLGHHHNMKKQLKIFSSNGSRNSTLALEPLVTDLCQ